MTDPTADPSAVPDADAIANPIADPFVEVPDTDATSDLVLLEATEEGAVTVVTITCEFEKGAIDLVAKVEDKHVVSLFFQPNLKLAYQSPPYVQPDAFHDVEVKVNTGDTVRFRKTYITGAQ